MAARPAEPALGRVRQRPARPAEGAPVIRIRHRGVCGSLNLRSRPTLADQLMEGARRLTERLSQPRD
jgi:hypothetical protein